MIPPGTVSQPAEETASNPAQCGFDPHRSHVKKTVLERYDELVTDGLSMREIATRAGIRYATLRDSVRRRERNRERRQAQGSAAIVWARS